MSKTLFSLTLGAAALATAYFGPDVSAQHRPKAPAETQLQAEARPVARIHTQMPNFGLEVYAGVASDIVLADVVSKRTLDRPDRMLETVYELDIVQSYLGERTERVLVNVVGGETAERVHIAADAPSLSEGDRKLFFLASGNHSDIVGIVGLGRGVYDVTRTRDGLVATGHHAPQGVDLEVFVEDVREARLQFDAQQEVVR